MLFGLHGQVGLEVLLGWLWTMWESLVSQVLLTLFLNSHTPHSGVGLEVDILVPSRALHAILWFLLTWLFKVCMTMDLGDS